MNALITFLPYISMVLAVCVTVGGMVAFRNGRQIQLTKFQEDTNKVLKNRIDALEDKIADLEKENIIQRHVIDTITSALQQRGLIITISGDMVTISDQSGSTTHRKRTTTTPRVIVKKDDDDNE